MSSMSSKPMESVHSMTWLRIITACGAPRMPAQTLAVAARHTALLCRPRQAPCLLYRKLTVQCCSEPSQPIQFYMTSVTCAL